MNKLKLVEIFDENDDIRNDEHLDCMTIKHILEDNGYISNLPQCRRLWKLYSNSLVESWVDMLELTDSEIFNIIKIYIRN